MDSHGLSIGSARRPLVSVVVPAYNVSNYIEETLRSLAEQTVGDFEIIVVDDASTDGTATIVEGWNDPRLRLVRHAVNRGVAVARNTALDHARGRYIAHLDPDDIAFPRRIELQLQALESDPDLGMIGASDAVMNESGASTGQIWKHPTNPVEANIGMFFENSFSTSTLMMRAEAISGQRYLETRISEDYEFNARIARTWKVSNLAEPLVWRRRRGDSLTATLPEEMLDFNKRVIRDHLGILHVSPSDRQLELCLHLGKKNLNSSIELLDEIDSWLATLCDANEALQRFEVRAFNRIIARRWFDICNFSSDLGPSVLRRFTRGNADLNGNLTSAEWLRLGVKCLLWHGNRA